MATDLKQQAYGTLTTVLDTGLNTLATAGKAISAALDNGTLLNLFDDLELTLANPLSGTPTAGMLVDIYIIPSIDGTNYIDGDASVIPPSGNHVGSFTARAVTTAQRLSLRDVPLPPGLFKYLLINNLGVSFASSGNILKRRPHNMQIG
jgi:hypothetical protein